MPGESAVYSYPNNQLPATLWYHDHAMGITRLNVYLGLAGFYLLRDVFEQNLGLPSGEFEIPHGAAGPPVRRQPEALVYPDDARGCLLRRQDPRQRQGLAVSRRQAAGSTACACSTAPRRACTS